MDFLMTNLHKFLHFILTNNKCSSLWVIKKFRRKIWFTLFWIF